MRVKGYLLTTVVIFMLMITGNVTHLFAGEKGLEPGIYAIFETTMGDITSRTF